MSDIETTRVWLANFNTSADAAQIGKDLFNRLGFSSHYQLARLQLSPRTES